MSENEPRLDLVLYTRADCHLCGQMLDALAAWHADYAFTVCEVDVDRDPDLRHRYGARVPVLSAAGDEICHYVLDEQALLARLRAGR